MPRLTSDEAAKLTWARVSLEADPDAVHGLSADIVAYTEEGFPVISVIHLEDRRHWNLTVWPYDAGDLDPAHQVVNVMDLAETLTRTVIADGTQLRMFDPRNQPQFEWLALVEVLPPARNARS